MIVRLHPLAEQDVFEAASFYESEGSVRLAARFIAESDRLMGIVREQPNIGAPRKGGKRGLAMRSFPYTVIYRLEGDDIGCVACEARQKTPEVWQHTHLNPTV
jgi:plasmid stabilization system protein ParE